MTDSDEKAQRIAEAMRAHEAVQALRPALDRLTEMAVSLERGSQA